MKFKCYIYGKDSDWEAICTDLDIAVQGNSCDEAKSLLDEAIGGFLHEVEKLPVNDQKEFLTRRAPILLRISLYLQYSLFRLRKHSQNVSANVQQYSISSSFS